LWEGMESTIFNALMMSSLFKDCIRNPFGDFLSVVRGSCLCSKPGLRRKEGLTEFCRHNRLNSCQLSDFPATPPRISESNWNSSSGKTPNSSSRERNKKNWPWTNLNTTSLPKPAATKKFSN
jgi:hypothetical protein